MSRNNIDPSDWEQRKSRSTIRLGLWTASWVATMAIATFGPIAIWSGNETLTTTAILINVAIGVGMILAYMRYLMSVDEMQRRVELDAMAIALGVTVVAGLAYSNLDVANVIATDAEISHLLMLTSISYLAAWLIGKRRLQ